MMSHRALGSLKIAPPLLLLLAGAVSAPAGTPEGNVPTRESVPVDMVNGWLRRDWRQCGDATRVSFADGTITLATDSSSTLMWQVPSMTGPATPDGNARWARRCERPPLAFVRDLLREAGDRLIDLEQFPVLSWRWRVDATIADDRLTEPDGRIRSARNDFAAKVAVLVQVDDGEDVEEIAYVWARSLPESTTLFQETTILPFWKKRWYRIVAESGDSRLSEWVSERHDLAADFRRLFPGHRPGHVLRIHVMTDSDATRSRATGSFAGLVFARR